MSALDGTVEDHEEIRQLYARYAFAIDENLVEDWLDCFTEDGGVESVRFGRHAGREALRRFSKLYHDALGGAQPRHMIANPYVRIEGDRATGACYMVFFHCKYGKSERTYVSHYRDELRKENGRWLFTHRKLLIDAQF